MKFFLIFLIIVFKFNNILAQELIFFLDSAYKNNPQLKAERENFDVGILDDGFQDYKIKKKS